MLSSLKMRTPSADAGDCGEGADDRDDGDQDQLVGDIELEAEQPLEPSVDGGRAEPQRGREAEYGAEHGEQIRGVAVRAIDLLAQHRIERRAHGERQPLAIGEVGDRQTDQHVHRPAMQPQ